MSIAIGCGLADIFRAIAVMSGTQSSGCSNGDAAVSFWGSHGTNDATIPIAAGRSIRNLFLDRDDCGMSGASSPMGSTTALVSRATR